jgi:hypothetical protein
MEEGETEPSRSGSGPIGPGRPANPLRASVRPPISWEWRWCNPKSLWVLPIAGDIAIRLRGNPQGREVGEERDHSWDGSIESKEATTSGGGHRGPATAARRRRKTLSEASPWSTAPCLVPWWGKLLICPWGCKRSCDVIATLLWFQSINLVLKMLWYSRLSTMLFRSIDLTTPLEPFNTLWSS